MGTVLRLRNQAFCARPKEERVSQRVPEGRLPVSSGTETGSWTRGVTGRSGAAKFLLVSQASRNNILGNTSNERTEI